MKRSMREKSIAASPATCHSKATEIQIHRRFQLGSKTGMTRILQIGADKSSYERN